MKQRLMIFAVAFALSPITANAEELNIGFDGYNPGTPNITAAALAGLPAITVPVPPEPAAMQDKTVRATRNYNLHVGSQNDSKAFLAAFVAKLKTAGCVVINERVVVIAYVTHPDYKWGVSVDYIGPAVEKYITDKNALYSSPQAAQADIPNTVRNLEAAGYVVLRSGWGVHSAANNAWHVFIDYIKPAGK